MTNFTKRISYERLRNGADVYMVPTTSKDIIACSIALPGGSFVAEPQVLALLVAELLPGSTKKTKRSLLREKIDGLGASVAVSTQNRHFVVTLRTRRDVFAEVLKLTMEILSTPAFPQAEFSEAVARLNTQLLHLEEDTHLRASQLSSHAFFKKGHPHYITPPKVAVRELQALERKDVAKYFRSMLSSVGATVVVAGDLQKNAILPVLERELQKLPGRKSRLASRVHPERTTMPKEFDMIVPMRDKMNVDTLLTIPLALTQTHDDYYTLAFGAQILGASSTSRLFQTLRDKKSFTYGSYGSLKGTEDGYAGVIGARAIFPNNVFAPARVAFREVVKDWSAGNITSAELAARKEEVLGRQVVDLSTTTGLAGTVFGVLVSGRPVSFIDEYPDIVRALTPGKINKAIREHVNYDLAVTAAAGAVDKSGKPLA